MDYKCSETSQQFRLEFHQDFFQKYLTDAGTMQIGFRQESFCSQANVHIQNLILT